MSKAVATALSALTVLDLDGNPVPVGSLWHDRTRVLIWLRHYG